MADQHVHTIPVDPSLTVEEAWREICLMGCRSTYTGTETWAAVECGGEECSGINRDNSKRFYNDELIEERFDGVVIYRQEWDRSRVSEVSDIGGPDLIGFVVLTKQPDGAWRDDWDGVVHTVAGDAHKELERASAALGGAFVTLASVHHFGGGQSDG